MGEKNDWITCYRLSDYHRNRSTIPADEENAALSIFSAKYSVGLNGSGQVNKFHHAKGYDLARTTAGVHDFFRYADPGNRKAAGNRLDIHLVRANEAQNAAPAGTATSLAFM